MTANSHSEGTSTQWTPGAVPFGTGGDFSALRGGDAASVSTERAAEPAKSAKADKEQRRLKGELADYPHLVAMKPREGYVFHSDYFEVDGGVATILGYFHDESARDEFVAFWGIDRIPAGLGEGVSVVLLEQVRRMGADWVESHIANSERLQNLDAGEQATAGTARTQRKAAKVYSDVNEIEAEIADGASYLHVHNRLLVKAPDLDALDAAIEKIRQLYIERFSTISVATYPGEQRLELASVIRKNEKKRGRGQHFTSAEFAGSHSLVTNGLNDPTGEYVGSMDGDVNNSAVLFDVNGYEHHVVVADSSVNVYLNRAHIPDMWGSKVSQSALLNNHRVVHLILDGADMDTLGPKLSGLTARLDMNSGDINMFELFGKQEDELSLFPAHLEKVVLMAEQAYETTDDDRSIIRGSLKETLTQFYIDKGMWARNAKENRKRLRLVNLDHTHVPRLQDLVTYFDTQYKALANSTARDDEMLHAYNVLRLVFKDLLDNNGDLFNTYTSDEVDGVSQARRVLFDFSKILLRSKGLAMAQLVNTVGFAVDSLGLGDTVIIHGAEHIDSGVKGYINTQFERLFARGGRVAFLYNEVDEMLADRQFNRFDRADWTVLGPMTDTTAASYQKALGQDIPPDLETLIKKRIAGLTYLRRGVSNVVFHLELALGIDPARAKHREAIEARRASEPQGARQAPRERARLGAGVQPVRRALPGPARLPAHTQPLVRSR